MPEQSKQLIYQIRIKGELDLTWADHFECLDITHDLEGNTLLTGPIVDHTALHSILLKIRDMNLKLISVNEVPCSPNEIS